MGVNWEQDEASPNHHPFNDAPTTTQIEAWNLPRTIDMTSHPQIVSYAPPVDVFYTERYDLSPSSMQYTIPNLSPTQTYNVRFYACENYAGVTGTGQRLFDILINGSVVKAAWDVWAEAYAVNGTTGNQVAVVYQAAVKPDASGNLVITTANIVQEAMFNAIEVTEREPDITLGFLDGSPTVIPVGVLEASGQSVSLIRLNAPSAGQGAFTYAFSEAFDSFDDDQQSVFPISIGNTLTLLAADPQVFPITIEESEADVSSTELIGPFWFDVLDVDDATSTTSTSGRVSRSSSFVLGENDTLPALTGYVRNGRDAILDLSATGIDPASITFTMRNADDGTIQVDERACTWDTSTHLVTYQWLAPDSAVAGQFDGEIEVTLTSGGKFTAPGSSPKVHITIGGELS